MSSYRYGYLVKLSVLASWIAQSTERPQLSGHVPHNICRRLLLGLNPKVLGALQVTSVCLGQRGKYGLTMWEACDP
jgi:hypothetical protein